MSKLDQSRIPTPTDTRDTQRGVQCIIFQLSKLISVSCMKFNFFSVGVSKRLSAGLVTSLLAGLNINAVNAATNIPPTIYAGADTTVTEQTKVDLVAQASDQDGFIRGIKWQLVKGPKVHLSNAKSTHASFTAPSMQPGQSPILMVFKASAKDNSRATASDYVNITVYPGDLVDNSVPTVDAGSDQTVDIQTQVELSAAANDTDGNIASYQWTQTGGAYVNLDGANQANATFVSPDGKSATALSFTVTVSDDKGAEASDSINVNIEASNQDPAVYAGEDQTAFEQAEVSLFADASDPDGSIASYEWVQTGGNQVDLFDANTASAFFTAPSMADGAQPQQLTFDLTVIDDQGAYATDSVAISIEALAPATSGEECTTTINPGESFDNAFSQLSAGDTLCLNDGIYYQAMDIPSNIHVRAVNDGMAEIDGNGSLGEDWSGGLLQMKGTNSSVRGLRVHHASTNADACHIAGANNTMRLTSCSHGGAHKHKIPLKVGGSGHLIEDSWAYGEGRYVVQCFLGEHITIRRTVARWDSTAPNNPTEPNAAFSIYNCSDITVENNISLDYGVPETEMKFGGDFYSPHNNAIYPELNHDNHFLGNIVVNHSPGTLNNRAFRADTTTSTTIPGGIVRDFYIRDSQTDFAIKSSYDFDISKCTRENVINESVEINCNNDADISVRYQDGSKTMESLFPFSHEALIKRDMCASGERQSDWCTSGLSLGDYIINR